MSLEQCRRRHPEHGDQCHKRADLDHREHHNASTDRRWTDDDYPPKSGGFSGHGHVRVEVKRTSREEKT